MDRLRAGIDHLAQQRDEAKRVFERAAVDGSCGHQWWTTLKANDRGGSDVEPCDTAPGNPVT